MKLIIRNKLFSFGGGSTVKDENDKDIFEVKGNFFSLTRKKRIYDMDGNELYIVRNKYWKLFFASSFIFDPNKNKIAHIKQHLSVNGVYASNIGDLNIRIAISDAFYKKTIFINEKEIASYQKIIYLTDSFEVDLLDDSYASLVTAIIIAIDNIHDRHRNEGQ